MKILNYGSLNIDYTYRLEHIVIPGETISSKGLDVFPGGKGLNQSIALARAGAQVYHAGMVGQDGMFLKDYCEKNGVNTTYISEVDARTGNAIIQVSDDGSNSIILFPGANRTNTREKVDKVLMHFDKGDVLLLQNEINEIDYLIDAAKEKGMKVVLNPSPFDEKLNRCKLEKVDIFLLNEVEGEQITGEHITENMLSKMKELYPKAGYVVTLGKLGSVYADKEVEYRQKAISVKAVDTTAAGDTFTGYFLTAVLEEKSKEEALEIAAAASAMAVMKEGASVSIPTRGEVEAYMSGM